MKKISLITFAILAIALAGCMRAPEGDRAATSDAIELDGEINGKPLTVDTSASYIEWLGTKPGGNHYGKLRIKEGVVYVDNGTISGGKFTLDITSISVDDIKDAGMNKALRDHLLSADFFHVDSFPKGYFRLAEVTPLKSTDPEGNATHTVTGNLKIKGITRSVSFTANMNGDGDKVLATTPQFVLDRTNWNINYGSRSIFANLKDNFIHDEMAIKIYLVANK